MPQPEWRYFVIAFNGVNKTIIELQKAFELASVELEVAFTVGSEPQEYLVWNAARLFHVLQSASYDGQFFVEVGGVETTEIAAIYEQLRAHDYGLLNIEPQLLQLNQLKSLPHNSPLRLLGYFALLESLLTHQSEPKDPYDSITRQIKKKLTLLTHRWPRAIDYGPFDGTDPETVWTKMYSYRSTVAHGGVADFTSGELKVLKSQPDALKLVKDTAKAILRYALNEPQLLIDLREC